MSIPFIHIPSIPLGPLDIQPFGILVAAGVMLASWMGRKYAERNGLDEETFRVFSVRVLVIGFISCHVFNVLFYDLDRAMHPFVSFKQPGWLLWFMIWEGISSWGGIVGGAAAFLWYSKKLKMDRLAWADLMSWCAVGGWLLGRAACAVVHDHTGGPTDFFLGLHVPDPPPSHTPSLVARYAGQTIHDLGLYEFLYIIPIFAIIVLAERIPRRKPGLLMGMLAVLYSGPRFFLDNLRPEETDPRYGGLTFAQWCCIGAFIFGLVLLLRPRATAVPTAVASETPAPARKKKR